MASNLKISKELRSNPNLSLSAMMIAAILQGELQIGTNGLTSVTTLMNQAKILSVSELTEALEVLEKEGFIECVSWQTLELLSADANMRIQAKVYIEFVPPDQSELPVHSDDSIDVGRAPVTREEKPVASASLTQSTALAEVDSIVNGFIESFDVDQSEAVWILRLNSASFATFAHLASDAGIVLEGTNTGSSMSIMLNEVQIDVLRNDASGVGIVNG